MSTKLITSGKRQQIVRLLEDGLDKVELDDSRAQRLIERGGELQAGLQKLLTELSVSDRYAEEELPSRYGYLSGYNAPKPLPEQVGILKEFFPDLGTFDERVVVQDLPVGTEGFFAIPRWQKIAATYGEAVEKVLDLIKQTRNGKFYNFREGQLGLQYLRQHERTVRMFQQMAEQQAGHHLLVVPAQFGLRHRGRSVCRAREVFSANEFGLGAYHVGVMLLTHPERLHHYDDLWVDCAGDEFAPDVDGVFVRAPRFSFGGGQVRFGACYVDSASEHFGSVSAFFPH